MLLRRVAHYHVRGVLFHSLKSTKIFRVSFHPQVLGGSPRILRTESVQPWSWESSLELNRFISASLSLFYSWQHLTLLNFKGLCAPLVRKHTFQRPSSWSIHWRTLCWQFQVGRTVLSVSLWIFMAWVCKLQIEHLENVLKSKFVWPHPKRFWVSRPWLISRNLHN